MAFLGTADIGVHIEIHVKIFTNNCGITQQFYSMDTVHSLFLSEMKTVIDVFHWVHNISVFSLQPVLSRNTLESHYKDLWKTQKLSNFSAPNHYLNQYGHIVNWTFTKKIQWNLLSFTITFIQENAFENVGHFICLNVQGSFCVCAQPIRYDVTM